ncbi:MAG: hypothetical protein ACI4F7_07735 [Acutalibacteraceae bacterium]
MDQQSVLYAIVMAENAYKRAMAYVNTIIAAFPKGMRYIGQVDYYADLDNVEKELGYTYTVKYKGAEGTEISGAEYAWGEYEGTAQWIPLGPDISGKVDKLPGVPEGRIAVFNSGGGIANGGIAAEDILVKDNIGQAGYVASLNDNGEIPVSQLPVSATISNGLLSINIKNTEV